MANGTKSLLLFIGQVQKVGAPDRGRFGKNAAAILPQSAEGIHTGSLRPSFLWLTVYFLLFDCIRQPFTAKKDFL